MSKLVLLLGLVLAARAEDPPAATTAAPEPLLQAIQLPETALALRDDGVPEDDVKLALKAAKDKQLPASEAEETLAAADQAVKEHGPVDNFGAFVQQQLDAGKRGKELADAIKAEHQAHGKGKAGEHGKDGEHGEHGKDGEHGAAGEHGKPDDKGGKPEDKGGKPEDKGGKPEDKGGKPDNAPKGH